MKLFFAGGLLSDGFALITCIVLTLIALTLKYLYSFNLQRSLKLLYSAGGLLLFSIAPLYIFLYLQQTRGLFPNNNGLGLGFLYSLGSWPAKILIVLSAFFIIKEFFKCSYKKILILFLIILLGFACSSFAQPAKTITELVVPQRVSVFLSSSVEGSDRIPVLVLSADAGGGCDSASALQTQESFSDNSLVVDIEGYKFSKGTGEVCPAVVLESRAKVNIDADWLKKPDGKEIIFRLNGQENKYKISYSQYRVTLSGVHATNVLTLEPGDNFPETPVNLEVVLYPPDVAVLYLAGSVSSDQDYRAALNNFSQAKGFVPADQVYAGLQQTEKNRLYVVVKDRPLPEPAHADSLGELPGKPGVGVYLIQISGLGF